MENEKKNSVTENVSENEAALNYAFDCGFQNGYGSGKVDGKKEGFSEGFDSAVKAVFHDLYSFNSTVMGAEEFIKRFNEKFKGFSILQARIGVNPATMTPTAFFVTNLPDEREDELIEIKRSVERDIRDRSDARPICVWSVQNDGICEDSIKDDFPMARRAL